MNARQKFTTIAEVDTTGTVNQAFHAVGIRAAGGQSLGKFRWLVWRVYPVTGIDENTAYPEFQIQAKTPITKGSASPDHSTGQSRRRYKR
ncbi:MAG: hypothetical protein NTU53_22975 [Planctomycetota bacterium]|nr:hypothetical protein [Planctomycetota bacterium]